MINVSQSNTSPRVSSYQGKAPQETPPPPDRSWLGDAWEKVKDVKTGVDFLVAGLLFLHGKDKAAKAEEAKPPLDDVPDVKLNRPVMMCPGWNTEYYKFDFLANKLAASGQNGSVVYLSQGKAYRDNQCTVPLDQIPTNSKVFVTKWDNPNTPPELTSLQLKQNMDLLQSAVGPTKVDVIGFSMGGLATRKYLDQGGEHVGKFVTLGTPHQGTRFGQLCDRLLSNKVDWATKFGGLEDSDLPAMQWLAADKPNLKDLNQRWPEQRARVEDSLFIRSTIEPTPSTGFLPFAAGDGLVELSHATLPGAPSVVLTGTPLLNHVMLPHDSQVFQEMQRFLGWESQPGVNAQPVPPTPRPDRPKTPYGEI